MTSGVQDGGRKATKKEARHTGHVLNLNMDSFQPLRQSGLDSALCYRRFSHGLERELYVCKLEYRFGGGGKGEFITLPRATLLRISWRAVKG
jgi:hypothetical protein